MRKIISIVKVSVILYINCDYIAVSGAVNLCLFHLKKMVVSWKEHVKRKVIHMYVFFVLMRKNT